MAAADTPTEIEDETVYVTLEFDAPLRSEDLRERCLEIADHLEDSSDE